MYNVCAYGSGSTEMEFFSYPNLYCTDFTLKDELKKFARQEKEESFSR